MKAAFFRRYGPPEVLEYGELPDPVAAAGEVLVEIHAASVNAADWKQRAGQYPSKVAMPHIPGRDFSGVVAAVGEGARDFRPGEAVFGVCEVPAESAYAEKVALRQEIVARKPERFSHAECAAAGLAALTALISIEETLQLAAGETVLIHGGAGGVAGFAIQLAKHIGARVVSTASASNHEYVRGLGADAVILPGAGLHARGVRLRRGFRYGGRRSHGAQLCRAAAGWPPRQHCRRRSGAGFAARGRGVAAPQGGPRPAPSRACSNPDGIGRVAAA